MLLNKLTALGLLGLLGAASSATGQGLGNSPYSRLGLGDVNPNTGGVRQQGMGGVGVAAPNTAQVNELNPALIYYNNRTTYEVAAIGQLKRLRSGSASQVDGGASLSYLAFAVPISRRWGLAAGLKPYSTVDYKTAIISPVQGTTDAQVLEEYTGSGGLSEVYLSQGVRLAKGLSAGVTTSYVFGSVDQSTTALLVAEGQTAESLSRSADIRHTEYSDLTIRLGSHYRYELSSKYNLNLGAVYTLQSDMKGYRERRVERQDVNGITIESLQLDPSSRGQTVVPSNLQIGLGLDNNKTWTLNADVSRQQWSKFEAFRLPSEVKPATPLYQDTWRGALGGELTPDPGSVDSYFKRVSYRFGVSVAQLPYRPGGVTQYDRAISWGFMFPFPTASPLDATSMNLAFTYGQRGNQDLVSGTAQRNIKEDYVRVQLGISLNNRWFLKRKVE
ncbi:hypothetical protein F0P96_08060 [Hymenobacter busanensis]|uniref:Uncharacterized protein n=1 Tax=Hymenobacter busanensis TaxID=2607656 RepID=A0A7L5A1U4_9BACT|nr:outer membrane protein transport protein [Hymenobacter busanensis]KAA9332934.1 hypothetical protein F0P96_08060 [Hymenobacter busanensis]QHJ08392.1 hypothetical protein GUY19_14270 [Hymenobacter busanensis]